MVSHVRHELFDPVVREKAGMRWTPGDEILLRLFGKAVEAAFVVVPMHYFPRRKTLVERAGSLVHTTFSLAGLRPAPGRGRAA